MLTSATPGSQAIVNFGNGYTTPVNILSGGADLVHYKVYSSLNKSWQDNSKIFKSGMDTYLKHDGHKILIEVLQNDGNQSKIAVLLNDGWIAEYLLFPVK